MACPAAEQYCIDALALRFVNVFKARLQIFGARCFGKTSLPPAGILTAVRQLTRTLQNAMTNSEMKRDLK